MDRIVRALDVHGLVNAQFIVREDGVYLIEVNPRASRTVPFMSKVTGVPMVKLAVRIALGEKLADMGWPNGLLRRRRSRRGEGSGLLHGQASRRGPVGGPGHAVHGRGHRNPHGPARGARQGDAGGGAHPAATRRRRRACRFSPSRSGITTRCREWRTRSRGRATASRQPIGTAGELRKLGYEAQVVSKVGEKPLPGPDHDPGSDRLGQGAARREHAVAQVRPGPRRDRDPPGRDRRWVSCA